MPDVASDSKSQQLLFTESGVECSSSPNLTRYLTIQEVSDYDEEYEELQAILISGG